MNESVVTSLERVEQHLELLGSVFLGVILLEAFLDWRARRERDFKDTAANLVVGVGQELLGRLVGVPIALVALSLFAKLALWKVPLAWWSWPAGLVLSDFFYYWSHRLEHRSRLFWAHHSVHHSSEGFDFSTAGRIAWAEPFVAWYSLVPLVLLGFEPMQVLVLSSMLLLYQTWVHTQKIGRVGALEGIVNTPSAHRVHHGSNPEYLDANYGAVLMVWDRLFGTYVEEDAPVRFGLTTPIGTYNPLRINAHEYAFIARQLGSRTKSWREALLWVFGPPEWSPEKGLRETRASSWWHRLLRSVPAAQTSHADDEALGSGPRIANHVPLAGHLTPARSPQSLP
jgi:sterol desaturase/sphingolipid hydroxylase (fatty acid hydroxylase superfamily)